MSMSGFAARGNAVEGSFFRKEQEFALRKHLERLVAEGQLPQSALQQHTPLDLVANRGPDASTSHVSVSDVPVSVLKGRPASDYVYQHVKGVVPGKSRAVAFRHYFSSLTVLLPCSAQAQYVLVHAGYPCELWAG